MPRCLKTPPRWSVRLGGCLAVVFFVLALPTAPLLAQANVTVRKQAASRNPSTAFRRGSVPSSLAAEIAKNIHNCGWFDTAPTSAPEIVMTGSSNGSTATIQVSRPEAGISFSISAKYAGRNSGDVARSMVDAILKKLFRVPVLCRSKIAFCAKTSPTVQEILICRYDGSDARAVTRNGAVSAAPDWEPGQKRLVYALHGKAASTFVEYDVASKRSRRLARYPGLNSAPAISPDGKYFAAVLSKDGDVDLYVKSINTRWIRRLTKSPAVEASPCWSPSGAKICFVSNASGKPRLYVVSLAGGAAKKLATLGTEAVAPDWSANNEIVYSAKMGRNYALAIVDLSGKKPPRVVISAAGDWESPSWAPDARHIVAARTLNGKTALYVVDSWTGKAKRILAGKVPLAMPAW